MRAELRKRGSLTLDFLMRDVHRVKTWSELLEVLLYLRALLAPDAKNPVMESLDIPSCSAEKLVGLRPDCSSRKARVVRELLYVITAPVRSESRTKRSSNGTSLGEL